MEPPESSTSEGLISIYIYIYIHTIYKITHFNFIFLRGGNQPQNHMVVTRPSGRLPDPTRPLLSQATLATWPTHQPLRNPIGMEVVDDRSIGLYSVLPEL